MLFNWPVARPVNRLGYRFVSDMEGNLEIDIDSLKKKIVEIDEEGAEYTTKEAISDEEKSELLSALKCYGFTEVKPKKVKEEVV